MVSELADGPVPLAAVPPHQRHRILSGMRWNVWLAVLAMPFSAGTSILLARIGPEVIGVYGLLSVYIAIVVGVLYLGGDVVIIKFMPECPPERRISFLVSYFLIICLALTPWMAIATLWPQATRFVFGGKASEELRLAVVALAPIPIASAVVLAALKGMLEIRWSQVLTKSLPILTALVYGCLFVVNRPLLATYYTEVIWATYLSLLVVLTAVGVARLYRVNDSRLARRCFYLPRGFWKYVFATQFVAAVNLFSQRLDYVLILNIAGLGLLGDYVALNTVANTIPILNGFFVDTLLPSLTNLIASRNTSAAAQVLSMHVRILLLVNTMSTCAVMLLSALVVGIMGPQYSGLQNLLVLIALFQGLGNPGWNVGGTLLSSIGKQQFAAWTGLFQTGLFTILLFSLWPSLGLTGAVIAYGVASVLCNGALALLGRYHAPFCPSFVRPYLSMAAVLLVTAGASVYLSPLSVLAAVPLWLGAILSFMVMSGYSRTECLALVHQYLPVWRSRIRISATTTLTPACRLGTAAIRGGDIFDQPAPAKKNSMSLNVRGE